MISTVFVQSLKDSGVSDSINPLFALLSFFLRDGAQQKQASGLSPPQLVHPVEK